MNQKREKEESNEWICVTNGVMKNVHNISNNNTRKNTQTGEMKQQNKLSYIRKSNFSTLFFLVMLFLRIRNSLEIDLLVKWVETFSFTLSVYFAVLSSECGEKKKQKKNQTGKKLPFLLKSLFTMAGSRRCTLIKMAKLWISSCDPHFKLFVKVTCYIIVCSK